MRRERWASLVVARTSSLELLDLEVDLDLDGCACVEECFAFAFDCLGGGRRT